MNGTAPAPAELKDGAVFDVAGLYASDKAARESACAALVALVQKEGPTAFTTVGFADATIKALTDKKSPAATRGCCPRCQGRCS